MNMYQLAGGDSVAWDRWTYPRIKRHLLRGKSPWRHHAGFIHFMEWQRIGPPTGTLSAWTWNISSRWDSNAMSSLSEYARATQGTEKSLRKCPSPQECCGQSGPPRKETPLHIKGEEQPQLPLFVWNSFSSSSPVPSPLLLKTSQLRLPFCITYPTSSPASDPQTPAKS